MVLGMVYDLEERTILGRMSCPETRDPTRVARRMRSCSWGLEYGTTFDVHTVACSCRSCGLLPCVGVGCGGHPVVSVALDVQSGVTLFPRET